MTLVAGIDSSTQNCKIVIVDAASGSVAREGRAAHPAGTEVDPEAWWVALQDAIADADGMDDVVAVSIAGQQHGMVVLDADGNAIRDALLWNDTRSAAAATQLGEEFPDIVARTGSRPVASFTATKLRWLRDAEPGNAARVAAVALPHDWLTWRLRGFGPGNADFAELTTDRSDASGTSYWNPHTDDYDRELLVAALGHDAILPRVLGPGESAGTLASGALVGPGAGDNAGAALGLGARDGDVVVSIGTSGTVFAVTGSPAGSDTVAGFADASGIFLPLVATLAAKPGAGGLVLQPWFEGERTPDRPDATATLFGMTLAGTTRENLARAAIEGLLCGLADGLDAVRAVGVEARRILLIGGAAQNRAVSAIAAQVFDVPVVVPEPGEYVARGAAVQAAWVATGARPDWIVPLSASPASDHHPVIRAQYAARL